jgi:hypothetical protein
MSETVGCGRATGVVAEQAAPDVPIQEEKQEVHVTARVGQHAPDFTAPAYHKGTFGQVSLSDYTGKWVMVCFYPGDFTFV